MACQDRQLGLNSDSDNNNNNINSSRGPHRSASSARGNQSLNLSSRSDSSGWPGGPRWLESVDGMEDARPRSRKSTTATKKRNLSTRSASRDRLSASGSGQRRNLSPSRLRADQDGNVMNITKMRMFTGCSTLMKMKRIMINTTRNPSSKGDNQEGRQPALPGPAGNSSSISTTMSMTGWRSPNPDITDRDAHDSCSSNTKRINMSMMSTK